MRSDPATARRWVVLALAAAAGLLWIMTLFGLGGWTGGAPPAAAPPWTLPPREAAAGYLGAPEAYAEIGTRPLFTRDRRPQPFVIDAGESASASAPEWVLTGVLLTPTLEVAILTPGEGGEPVRVQRGEALPGRPGWHLRALAPRQAVFDTPDGLIRLELRGSNAAAAPVLAVPGGGAAAAGRQIPNDGVRSAEHQARIEAVRRRVAERRAQLSEQAATSSNPTHNPTQSGGD